MFLRFRHKVLIGIYSLVCVDFLHLVTSVYSTRHQKECPSVQFPAIMTKTRGMCVFLLGIISELNLTGNIMLVSVATKTMDLALQN